MRRDAYRILQATETAIYLFAGFLIALGAVFLLGSTLWDGVRALLQGGGMWWLRWGFWTAFFRL